MTVREYFEFICDCDWAHRFAQSVATDGSVIVAARAYLDYPRSIDNQLTRLLSLPASRVVDLDELRRWAEVGNRGEGWLFGASVDRNLVVRVLERAGSGTVVVGVPSEVRDGCDPIRFYGSNWRAVVMPMKPGQSSQAQEQWAKAPRLPVLP